MFSVLWYPVDIQWVSKSLVFSAVVKQIEGKYELACTTSSGVKTKRFLPCLSFSCLPLRVTEEESTATTMEALKARIRELERQILRGDRYKCLICMVSIPQQRTCASCPSSEGTPASMCEQKRESCFVDWQPVIGFRTKAATLFRGLDPF